MINGLGDNALFISNKVASNELQMNSSDLDLGLFSYLKLGMRQGLMDYFLAAICFDNITLLRIVYGSIALIVHKLNFGVINSYDGNSVLLGNNICCVVIDVTDYKHMG